MSEDFDDNENEDYKSIDLRYTIYSDEEHGTVYVKFDGFENKGQMDNFIDFMDMSIPLIMHRGDTKH